MNLGMQLHNRSGGAKVNVITPIRSDTPVPKELLSNEKAAGHTLAIFFDLLDESRTDLAYFRLQRDLNAVFFKIRNETVCERAVKKDSFVSYEQDVMKCMKKFLKRPVGSLRGKLSSQLFALFEQFSYDVLEE